jgi:acyl carrier protein
MNSAADILADLAGMLANFQGREYSGEIRQETLFFGDLGFASIDAVVLGEKLEEFYGRKIAFNRFLADAWRRKAQDISVGELADFLAEHVDPGL